MLTIRCLKNNIRILILERSSKLFIERKCANHNSFDAREIECLKHFWICNQRGENRRDLGVIKN